MQREPQPARAEQRGESVGELRRHWRWVLALIGGRRVERVVVLIAAVAVPLATWVLLHK